MKRTRKLVLTTAMAAGGFSLAACGDNPADNVRIENPGRSVDAFAYQSLAECKAKNEVPDEACEKAERSAWDDQNKAANFSEQRSCEDVYGQGQCVPRSASGGGSFWGPLAAGFIVGRMLDGGWGGRGMYRDWRDGGYYTSSGGRLWTDYSTGRTQVGSRGFDPPTAIQGPAKVQTRASVISRGGFGGRMSSRSYGGGRGFGG
jgi:uncharacterized protein YgiB involved in biofilm formation